MKNFFLPQKLFQLSLILSSAVCYNSALKAEAPALILPEDRLRSLSWSNSPAAQIDKSKVRLQDDESSLKWLNESSLPKSYGLNDISISPGSENFSTSGKLLFPLDTPTTLPKNQVPNASYRTTEPPRNYQAPIAQIEPFNTLENDENQNALLINFNNISIIEYIRFISRNTGKNFIFDENDLQFNVTVISEEPATTENIMTALMQELRIHNLSMIEQGNNIIIHRNQKVNSISELVDDTTAVNPKSEIITQVFRLNTANPDQVAAIIKPLTSESALVEVMNGTNNLIITDLSSNVKQIAKLIKSIDSPVSGLVIGQYVVESSRPDVLIEMVRQVIAPISQDQPLTMVPWESSRSIFIVSTPFIVERTISMLRHLDQNQRATKIFNLKDLQFSGSGSGSRPPRTPRSPSILPQDLFRLPADQQALYRAEQERLRQEEENARTNPNPSFGAGSRGASSGFGDPSTSGRWRRNNDGNWYLPFQAGPNGEGSPLLPPPLGTPSGFNPASPLGVYPRGRDPTSPLGAFPTGSDPTSPLGAFPTRSDPSSPLGAFPTGSSDPTSPFGVFPTGSDPTSPLGVFPSGGYPTGTQPRGRWRLDSDGNWNFEPGDFPLEDSSIGPNGQWVYSPTDGWAFLLNKGEPLGVQRIERQPQQNAPIPLAAKQKTFFSLYKLKYRKGNSIQAALQAIAASLGSAPLGFGGPGFAGPVPLERSENESLITTLTSVQFLESSNSLIFTGFPDDIVKVRELMRDVDVPLRQVFIEMVILSTSLADSLEYGVSFGSRFGGGNFAGAQGFTADPSPLNNTLSGSIGATDGLANGAGLGPGVANSLIARQGLDLGVIGQRIINTAMGVEFSSIGGLLHALRTKDNLNIILSPKIITEDNVPAEIFVGQNISFKTQSISNGSSSDNNNTITNNFEFRDVGTRLRVTPTIGSNDVISLEISQEISDIIASTIPTGGNANNQPGPSTTKSTTTTRVHLPDGYFLIISGMMRDDTQRTSTQVPCLGAIPVLGAAFKSKVYTDSKRNQMIFLRPRIIDTEEEIQNLTKHEQDIWEFKKRRKQDWLYESEQAFDFLNLKRANEEVDSEFAGRDN